MVSYKWFRRTENITELGLDYKEVEGWGRRCEYLTWWYSWGVFVLGWGVIGGSLTLEFFLNISHGW